MEKDTKIFIGVIAILVIMIASFGLNKESLSSGEEEISEVTGEIGNEITGDTSRGNLITGNYVLNPITFNAAADNLVAASSCTATRYYRYRRSRWSNWYTRSEGGHNCGTATDGDLSTIFDMGRQCKSKYTLTFAPDASNNYPDLQNLYIYAKDPGANIYQIRVSHFGGAYEETLPLSGLLAPQNEWYGIELANLPISGRSLSLSGVSAIDIWFYPGICTRSGQNNNLKMGSIVVTKAGSSTTCGIGNENVEIGGCAETDDSKPKFCNVDLTLADNQEECGCPGSLVDPECTGGLCNYIPLSDGRCLYGKNVAKLSTTTCSKFPTSTTAGYAQTTACALAKDGDTTTAWKLISTGTSWTTNKPKITITLAQERLINAVILKSNVGITSGTLVLKNGAGTIVETKSNIAVLAAGGYILNYVNAPKGVKTAEFSITSTSGNYAGLSEFELYAPPVPCIDSDADTETISGSYIMSRTGASGTCYDLATKILKTDIAVAGTGVNLRKVNEWSCGTTDNKCYSTALTCGTDEGGPMKHGSGGYCVYCTQDDINTGACPAA